MDGLTALVGDAEHVVTRMSGDVRKAASELGPREARFLVDEYYRMQDQRIRNAHQTRAAKDEPNAAIAWLTAQSSVLELQLAGALGRFSKAQPIGVWMQGITGIGPVLSAGLIAYVDIMQCNTAGKLWSYAGLNPESVWGKGEKRPWNANLKKLCWKIGESFVKTQNLESDYYGKVFVARKAYEWRNNLAGEYSEQALERASKVGKDTVAWQFYSGQCQPAAIEALLAGKGVPANYKASAVSVEMDDGTMLAIEGVPMLPPAHVHARAKRYAVKLFLSHLQQVWWELETGTPAPLPYPIAHLDHVDFIPPPAWKVLPRDA